jgi:hypothetical protein
MRFQLLPTVAMLLLVSCGSQAVSVNTVSVSSVIDENARLRAENERLRIQPASDAQSELAHVRARDEKRRTDLQVYAVAAQLWATDHDNKLPALGDDEFRGVMVSGKYLARSVPPPSANEHYCYLAGRDDSEYAFSAWLEEDEQPYTVGSDLAARLIAKTSRSAFFGEGCPRVPGWTSVRV